MIWIVSLATMSMAIATAGDGQDILEPTETESADTSGSDVHDFLVAPLNGDANDKASEWKDVPLSGSPTKVISTKKISSFTVEYELSLVSWWTLAIVVGCVAVCVFVVLVILGYGKSVKNE